MANINSRKGIIIMSLMSEYIARGLSVPDLEKELLHLVAKYNKARNTYLFIYATAMNKQIPNASLDQSDYYMFHDMLRDIKGRQNVDIYIETPGGSGETAEEIVRFLRNNFETVSFVISGEAKSAGTIMVMSGDDILMTETGSLGPIDAQIKIGRSVVSAYDYQEWVEQKRDEAEKNQSLNPFDATMIAQITPGEIGSVLHSLKFAQDLVCDWLYRYKFKNWTITKTRKIPVTEEMKRQTTQKIADALVNHSRWRSHGRSLKIEDLDGIGLLIKKVDEDNELSDIVYRIQTICRMIFETTTTFKIFATEKAKLFRHAAQANAPFAIPQQQLDVVEINQGCPKCGKMHNIYGKLVENPQIDINLRKKGFIPFPKDNKLKCICGFIIDLTGIKNQIESQMGKKMT